MGLELWSHFWKQSSCRLQIVAYSSWNGNGLQFMAMVCWPVLQLSLVITDVALQVMAGICIYLLPGGHQWYLASALQHKSHLIHSLQCAAASDTNQVHALCHLLHRVCHLTSSIASYKDSSSWEAHHRMDKRRGGLPERWRFLDVTQVALDGQCHTSTYIPALLT